MPLPNTIGHITERNTAGACKLQFIRAEDIETFPEEVLGTISAPIVPKAGKSFITVEPPVFTQEFQEDWLLVDGDQCAKASLAFQVPKVRPSLHDGFWKLKTGRYVILVHNLNRQVVVMGTPEEPAMLRMPKNMHGKGGGDRNAYEAQASVTRLTGCPFYGATPPAAVPNECPTLEELAPTVAWSVLQGYLTPQQIIDAVAALGSGDPCPTLCQLLDDAITLGDPEFTGVNATINGQSGFIPVTGTTNGKPSGTSLTWPGTDFAEFLWNGSAWLISDGFGTWISTEDVDTPGEVTTWVGADPLPTAEDVLAGGGDASAVVDCLSPEQAAALLAALGGEAGATLVELLTAASATAIEDALIAAGQLEAVQGEICEVSGGTDRYYALAIG